MIAALEQFIPAADEVGWLQRGDDAECRLFQKAAEQGHYAGRTQPTATRQGIYAVAPSGILLASVNTRSAEQVLAMLDKALERWRHLPEAERWLSEADLEAVASSKRWEDSYPDNGLVLRADSRDLPRQHDPRPESDWRRAARNRDMLWLSAEEAASLIPPTIEPGAVVDWPQLLANRLARLYLVDNVCGQVPNFDEGEIERAMVRSRITSIDDDIIHLRLEGETRAAATGRWAVDGFNDMDAPTPQERGVETTLLGAATFDRAAGRFISFEIVALGTRWGATQYNGRTDDAAPAGIGYLFTIAEPHERAAPSFIWLYGWRK